MRFLILEKRLEGRETNEFKLRSIQKRVDIKEWIDQKRTHKLFKRGVWLKAPDGIVCNSFNGNDLNKKVNRWKSSVWEQKWKEVWESFEEIIWNGSESHRSQWPEKSVNTIKRMN